MVYKILTAGKTREISTEEQEQQKDRIYYLELKTVSLEED